MEMNSKPRLEGGLSVHEYELQTWKKEIKKNMLDFGVTDGLVYEMVNWRDTHKTDPK